MNKSDRWGFPTVRFIHYYSPHATMRYSRRIFVLSAILCGSGCIRPQSASTPTPKSDRDGDGIPDSGDDYPNDSSRAVRTFQMEGTPTLQPGDFKSVALTNSKQASGDVLHYEVATSGDKTVDCVVFERDAYDAYEEGDRDVPTVSKYSRIDVTEAELTKQLDRGEYIFVVDYTELLTSPAEDSVEVDLSVELADPP